MIDAGIIVFRDNESLHVGEKIGCELLQAIENSKIYIPIFSENYASSHWCLPELAYMVECTSKSDGNKEILPIFLNVEPTDVKLKTNLYRQHLSKRQKTCTEVESWEKALVEVAKIKGWNWKKDEGQGDLIRSVIRKVLVKLKVTHENVTEHLVGVDDCVEAIVRMLDVRSDGVRLLGIYGMGGVGKTTLAKVVFNKLSSSFDQICFLADVRESSKCNNGLVNLQKQLLSKLLKPESTNQIYHENDGITMLNKILDKKKSVLVVLDDVDEKGQLRSLLGKGTWFSSCSRIIITTRDQSVLMIEGEAIGGDPINVLTYEAHEMQFDDALKQFSRHVFRRDSPPNHFVSLSIDVVSTLGKLPLALEIIGSSLHNKPKTLWVATLEKLKDAPPMEVQRKLMITYERLDPTQRQVFLDIACFFVNQDKACPFYMWNACGYHPHDALEVLSLMPLIKIKGDNTLWMHDQVRDLGRQIVHQENFDDPCERSRVWNPKEGLSIMKLKEGNRKIQALSIFNGGILPPDGFANLRNLRFFEGNEVSFVGNFNNLLSCLRWLSWRCYLDKFEATNFHLTNLVVLDLSSSYILEEWNGWNQIREASKLKILDLSKCQNLRRTPDLSTWVFLERLILQHCHGLIAIDPSIGKLKFLTTLNLYGCYLLQEVPKEIGCLQASAEIVMPCPLFLKTLGNIQSVLTLDVSNSHSCNLPLWIRLLVNIRRLNLSKCRDIKVLPNSIEKLQSLIELDLSWTSIGHLPDSIGNLKQLKVLRMSGIGEITTLPSSIGLMDKLEELDLSSTSIGHLPNSIGNLKQLKVLRMSGIREIIKLPSVIGQVEKLEELDTRQCCNLTGEIPEEIGRLSRLRILDLSDTCISGLPTSMSHLSNLQTLKLEKCPELKQLPELPPNLTCLTWGPKSCWFSSVEERKYEPHVYWQYLYRAREEYEHDIERRALEEYGIALPLPTRIGALSQQETPRATLPTSICTLSQLKTLKLCCKNVQFLPQLPSSLRELQLRDLATTRSLDFSNLKNLSILTFYGCSLEFSSIFDAESEELRMELCELRQVEAPLQLEMKRLRLLVMDKCEFLPEVLDLSCMKNLHEVSLRICLSLIEIHGLEELGSLCSLSVVHCPSVERMLDLSKLKKLSELKVTYCRKLKIVQGLNHLKSLMKDIHSNGGFSGDTSNPVSVAAIVSATFASVVTSRAKCNY